MRLSTIIILALTFIVWCLLGLTLARAHEKWWDGKEVDPVTKAQCCGDNDAFHLEKTDVEPRAGGWFIKRTGETIPYERSQPSRDGEFWHFVWGSPRQTQCFFAPVQFN